MSNRDPFPPNRFYDEHQPFHRTFGVNGSTASVDSGLDPSASTFQPGSAHKDQHGNGSFSQHAKSLMSFQSALNSVVERVDNLEGDYQALRCEIQDLQANHGCPSKVVQPVKADFKPESAKEFRQKLDNLKAETLEATSGSEMFKDNSTANSVIAPPHLRMLAKTADGTESIPPHLRKAGTKQTFVTDDKAKIEPFVMRPAPVLTPPPSEAPFPTSPATTAQPDLPRQSVEEVYVVRSGQGWMPCAVSAFPPLSSTELGKIPTVTSMVTFSYDFLSNHLGGIVWSPGLKYIPPSNTPCIVANRSYYLIDADYEPYLPRAPGEHGAKLTAFFNQSPEDVYGEEAGIGNFDNIPLFVCTSAWAKNKDESSRRYVYFGSYSQTRWSDKLDYDRLVEHVPNKVKEYWAEELSANGRAKWVSEALMKHFYPKPEYEGRLFGAQTEGSAAPEEETKIEDQVMKDVKGYVGELRDWEKDARLRTRLIKKDFIMKAFERADADDPPALRLWWEYLQCTGWDNRFYNLLVELQNRNKGYLV